MVNMLKYEIAFFLCMKRALGTQHNKIDFYSIFLNHKKICLHETRRTSFQFNIHCSIMSNAMKIPIKWCEAQTHITSQYRKHHKTFSLVILIIIVRSNFDYRQIFVECFCSLLFVQKNIEKILTNFSYFFYIYFKKNNKKSFNAFLLNFGRLIMIAIKLN